MDLESGNLCDEDRSALAACLQTKLFIPISNNQCPVVFHADYDVHFFGLENLHVFDAAKWGNVFRFLREWGLVSESTTVRPEEASKQDLSMAHSRMYLASLSSPCVVASIVEVPILCIIPPCIYNKYFLRRMRLQVGGTVAASRLALERNWAINIGGGFHHASRDRGGGFCVYADISLAVKMLLALKLVKKVIILDVDAHQGNGHERDFANESRVFIVDLFNPRIYPRDEVALHAISRAVPIQEETQDDRYLNILEQNIDAALGQFSADLLVYNAGTDSLQGDPLGRLSLTPEGIIRRDEKTFRMAKEACLPIVMVTSGGYQKSNAKIIAESIRNLHEQNLINLIGQPPTPAPTAPHNRNG